MCASDTETCLIHTRYQQWERRRNIPMCASDKETCLIHTRDTNNGSAAATFKCVPVIHKHASFIRDPNNGSAAATFTCVSFTQRHASFTRDTHNGSAAATFICVQVKTALYIMKRAPYYVDTDCCTRVFARIPQYMISEILWAVNYWLRPILWLHSRAYFIYIFIFT